MIALRNLKVKPLRRRVGVKPEAFGWQLK